jgi:hypothetical protein
MVDHWGTFLLTPRPKLFDCFPRLVEKVVIKPVNTLVRYDFFGERSINIFTKYGASDQFHDNSYERGTVDIIRILEGANPIKSGRSHRGSGSRSWQRHLHKLYSHKLDKIWIKWIS